MRQINASVTLMLCGLILASCETSRHVNGSVVEPEISPALKQPAPLPQEIRDGITNGELINALARDRSNLRACGQLHNALVQAIETRLKMRGR